MSMILWFYGKCAICARLDCLFLVAEGNKHPPPAQFAAPPDLLTVAVTAGSPCGCEGPTGSGDQNLLLGPSKPHAVVSCGDTEFRW